MTVFNTVSPQDPIIRATHLCVALNISDATITNHIKAKTFPAPDRRGPGQLKLWKLSTIRTWRPDVARTIEEHLKIPPVAVA